MFCITIAKMSQLVVGVETETNLINGTLVVADLVCLVKAVFSLYFIIIYIVDFINNTL